MKLKNKRTGEIGYPYFQNWKEITCVIVDENAKQIAEYTSLAELNEEWEDYEETKEYWCIDWTEVGGLYKTKGSDVWEDFNKEIGNYFETREEAEKAVEKLKAWKRLKDKGFRFEGIKQDYTRFFSQQKPIRIGRKYLQFNKAEDEEWLKENYEDLDLLFGGEK